jgi:CRISPR-associated protein Csh2
MSIVKNRSELIFLYDCKQCNPNGDPMNANRPRMVEETGKCLVTDVRLKRTIRDYLYETGYDGTGAKGDIFIRDEDGKVVTGEGRSKNYKDKNDFVNKYIDARLFGAVSAPKDKKKVFNLTGPVQFGMGSSLHEVKENFIKGTGAFASNDKASQKTFREEYNITYGLIGFHGVINENAAKHTQLTEADVKELMDGLWNGTKNLLSRSKKGHMPRLLIKVDYNEPNFFIGELLERLTIDTDKQAEELEDIKDLTVNTSELNRILEKYSDKIKTVTVVQDDRIQLSAPVFTK